MFESSSTDRRPGRRVCAAVRPLVGAMAGLALLEPAADGAGLVEQIAWLERLAAAAAGVQLQLMAAFADLAGRAAQRAEL
jgi:hypothetical protein